MKYRLTNLLLLLTMVFSGNAQLLPAVGAKLNYTQVMFEHPKVTGADAYLVQVDVDNGNGMGFPIGQSQDSSTATIISNLKFGKKYTWRYTGVKNGKQIAWYGPFSFEILKSNYIDTAYYRLRILKADAWPRPEGLVILDQARAIVDRNGNFVWFLPADSASNEPAAEVNDLRLTPAGTITFLNGKKAIETDLNGHQLWMAPKEETPGNPDVALFAQPYNYHHCFERMANGNYMVLSKFDESVPLSNTGNINSTGSVKIVPQVAGDPMSVPVPRAVHGPSGGVQFDVIKQFDKKGNLMWTWNSKNYFTKEEINAMPEAKPDSGMINREPGGHLNAFYIDEKKGIVYAGFRKVSRVVKIDLKTGKALHSWGASMKAGGALEGDGFFVQQHDVELLDDGSLAVFNNGSLPQLNSGELVEPSSVVIFSQPQDSTPSNVTWKFDCRFDGVNYHSIRGGSVTELKNGNLLVSMGRINRVFEVTRSKQIVWQGLMEKYEPGSSSWQPLPIFKANYASSLYPCYFTVITDIDTLTPGVPSFKVRIFNSGTESDQYEVKISSAHNEYRQQIASAVVKSRSSLIMDVAPNVVPKSNGQVTVTDTSKTNPDFERSVLLPFLTKGSTIAH